MPTNTTQDTSFETIDLVECPICNKLHSSVKKAENCYIDCATNRGKERIAHLEHADGCFSKIKRAACASSNPTELLAVANIGEYTSQLFEKLCIPLIVSVESVQCRGFKSDEKVKMQSTLSPRTKVEFDVRLRVSGSFDPKIVKVGSLHLVGDRLEAPAYTNSIDQPGKQPLPFKFPIYTRLQEKLEATLLPYYDETEQYGDKPISLKFPIVKLLQEVFSSRAMPISEIKASSEFQAKTTYLELDALVQIDCLSNIKEVVEACEMFVNMDKAYTQMLTEVKAIEAAFKRDIQTFLDNSASVQKLPELDAEIAQLQERLAQKLQEKKSRLKEIGQSLMPMQQEVSAKVVELSTPLNTQLRNLNVVQPSWSPPALGYGELAEYLPYAHALLRL